MLRTVFRCDSALAIAAVAVVLFQPPLHGAQVERDGLEAARIQRIRSAIDRRGSTRVIVRVATPAGSGPRSEKQQQALVGRLEDNLTRLAPRHLQRTIRRYGAIPYMAITVDNATLERLEASATVGGIYEDIAVYPTLFSSGTLVGATSARTRGYTGRGWAVAVLDTGIDATHPFLRDKVIAEGCWDSRSLSCSGDRASSTSPGSGLACGGPGCDHGTHVAGVATGNNNTGRVAFSGVAADAKLISIRVFDPTGSTALMSDVDAALQHVYELSATLRIAAVNLSFGSAMGYSGPCDMVAPSTKALVEQLRSVGIATVVASGNSGFSNKLSLPACISGTVSVGSTVNEGWGNTDTVSWFSNGAPFLSLLAPGQAVSSSIRGGWYADLQGTSVAAPQVAGAWALLKQAVPAAGVGDVLHWLRNTGKSILDPRNGVAVPRIQVDQALYAVTPPGDLQPVLLNYDGDQFRDVLLYNQTTGSWTIGLGTPDGQFFDGPIGGWLPGWDIHVADFNGDGLDDLFLYSPKTGVWYKAINTGLGFTYFTQAWQSGFKVFIVDLNSDGKSDVFVYNPITGVWFKCTSAGDGTQGFDYGTGDWAPGWQIVPADFEGDGKTDFLLYDPVNGAYYKAVTRGDGGFAYHFGIWAPGWSPLVLDLNADGRDDVFLYNVVNGVWYRATSTGDGTGEFDYVLGQWAPGWTVQAADFDGDAKDDLFLYQPSGVWYKAINSGSGFNYFLGLWGQWTTTVSDLNCDGKSDLFLYDPNSGLSYRALTTAPSSFTYTATRFH